MQYNILFKNECLIEIFSNLIKSCNNLEWPCPSVLVKLYKECGQLMNCQCLTLLLRMW
jgi:hypothetical protein